jgi:hypothetical protein
VSLRKQKWKREDNVKMDNKEFGSRVWARFIWLRI